MVNNYDRIFAEIQKEARRLAPERDHRPEDVIELAMEIVNWEDEHRVKPMRINRLIEGRVVSVAIAAMRLEEE